MYKAVSRFLSVVIIGGAFHSYAMAATPGATSSPPPPAVSGNKPPPAGTPVDAHGIGIDHDKAKAEAEAWAAFKLDKQAAGEGWPVNWIGDPKVVAEKDSFGAWSVVITQYGVIAMIDYRPK